MHRDNRTCERKECCPLRIEALKVHRHRPLDDNLLHLLSQRRLAGGERDYERWEEEKEAQAQERRDLRAKQTSVAAQIPRGRAVRLQCSDA